MGSLNIPNLVPGKKYAIQVRSIGADGLVSQWSETVSFTSPEKLTTPLTNSYTTSMTDSGQILAGGMKFGSNVNSTNNGIFINTNNYWYDTGNFAIGNGTSGVTWNGTTLAVAGQVTANSGTIGGWNISSTSISKSGIVLDSSGNKIYIGTGTFNSPDTAFYVDSTSQFSIGSALVWKPSTSTLTVNGMLQGYVNGTTAAPIIPANTMGIGRYVNITGLTGTIGNGANANKITVTDSSQFVVGMVLTKTSGTGVFAANTTVTAITSSTSITISPSATTSGSITFSATNATDGAYGIGLKLNSNNWWFADNPARIRIGSDLRYMQYSEQTGKLEIIGEITADTGYIGGTSGWNIIPGMLYSGSSTNFIGISSISGSAIPPTYTIDKILIDSEGSGYSSIYIRIAYSGSSSDLINKYITLPTSGITGTMWSVLTADPTIKWLIEDASQYDYAFTGADVFETSTLLTGKVTIIIYGEDNGVSITADETPTITGSPAVSPTTKYVSEPGIWMGDEVFSSAPLRLKNDGSGKIGGFLFYPTSSSTNKGILITDNNDANFIIGTNYTPPIQTTVDPIYGINILTQKSLNDAGLFYSTLKSTTFPTSSSEWLTLLKSTGLSITDATSSTSEITISPYVGIRAQSVSKLNVAKNGSFEYKVNSTDTSFTSSTSGWTAGTGLTLGVLANTTSGYSFPAFPYGQSYIGSLSWTSVATTSLSTSFRLDPTGTNSNFLVPGSTTYLTVGKASFHTDFAMYNISSTGKFNTDSTVAYPIKDITVTYTNTSNTTSTITSSNMSNSGTAISSQAFIDSALISLISTYNDINSTSITMPTFTGGYSYMISPYDIGSYSVSSVSRTTPSSTVITTSVAHPFSIGDSINVVDNTDAQVSQFYVKAVGSSTTLTIDDYEDNLVGVTVASIESEYPIVQSQVTRSKNSIEFDILSSAYSNAKYTSDFNINLPGYLYQTSISVPYAKTLTFTRAAAPLTLYNGLWFEVPLLHSTNASYYEYYATTGYLSNSSTTAVINMGPGENVGPLSTGAYDLLLDPVNGYGYANAAYTNTATSIVLYGDTTNSMLSYFPASGTSLYYIKIVDDVNSTVEYARVTAASFSAGLLTLTITRGQLSSTAKAISIDSTIYAIERINVTAVSSSTTYSDINTPLSQGLDISTSTVNATATKISNASIGFDELTISDQSIAYFDGSTGGGSVWGVNASKPNTWSYAPATLVAQLGGSPTVIGSDSGLSLIKSISYDPYTYLLYSPSITVQNGTGSYVGQSVLSISGGQYSLSSNKSKIDFITGSSSSTDGRIDITSPLVSLTGALTINGLLTIPTNTGSINITGGYLVRDSWHNVTFQNSWTNYAVSSFGYAGYRMYPDGTVRLKGLVKNATSTKTGVIFTLPAGYRPANSKIYQAIAASNGEARVDVSAAGNVSVYSYKNGGTAGFISLEGILFDVAGI